MRVVNIAAIGLLAWLLREGPAAQAQDAGEPASALPRGAVELRSIRSLQGLRSPSSAVQGVGRPELRPRPFDPRVSAQPRWGVATAPEPAPATAPQVPAGRLALELAATNAAGGTFKVVAGAGAIRTENSTTVLEIDEPGTTMVSSSLALEAAKQSAIRVNEKTALPWLVVDSRRTAEGISVRSARPFLALKQAIRWDAESGRHVAEFLFGLDADQGAIGPLTEPLLARFAVSCDAVEPARVQLRQLGAAGYDEVRVLCSPRVKNERPKHSIDVLADHGRLS